MGTGRQTFDWCMDSLSVQPTDRPGHQIIIHLPRYNLTVSEKSLSLLHQSFQHHPKSLSREEGETAKSRRPQVEVFMETSYVHEIHSQLRCETVSKLQDYFETRPNP